VPAGVTLRGELAGQIEASDGSMQLYIPFSFPVPFATAPPLWAYVPDGTTDPNCPGTVEAPEAHPGYVCIYEQFRAGANPAVVSPSAQSNGASRFGAGLRLDLLGGNAKFLGSWAAQGA
jgi:hypothetical protein